MKNQPFPVPTELYRLTLPRPSSNDLILLGVCSFCLMAGAHGQQKPLQPTSSKKLAAASAMTADYSLTSSSTAPSGTWRFTKGRLSVKRIDDRHFAILFACEWKKEPKAACSEWWTAQLRDGSLYLQDMNTDNISMHFDPATRAFTINSRGMDADSTLRTDVFHPDTQAIRDKALIRRMKTAQSNFESKENARVFGHYSTWEYSRARIQFPAQ
ncbi:hypothetical protein [Janthinobacterium fluminis]|uniref:META domain-containing protein n=1 Tax=Janthinobacterium fluminis TaxID=2987524 RepID=A0ABT5K922_9BURK|nr:hypothetical protein [Janthinobacterium fluminis]MDC8760948.1 hypothetical protein [Janthinobacterium fluminis]